MCIFRIMADSRYVCGKRYPLRCGPDICPFGRERWRILVNRDFKSDSYWLMPAMSRVSRAEALNTLKEGGAEYVVKAFSLSIARGEGRWEARSRTR